MLDLLEFLLRTAFFIFNGTYYQQTEGIAMGGPPSLTVAEIYMQGTETTALTQLATHLNMFNLIGTHTNPVKYKFDQTDRDAFESTLEAALSSGDIPELKSTQDIDKYADFIVTAISTAVDKAIPTSKSGRPEGQPVSNETLTLIKEKRRLRKQYS